MIINTARGKLIDTNALIEALDQGIVGGAGLDVLGEESVMRRRAERIISDQIIQRLREPIERPRVATRDPLRAKEIEKLMRLGSLLLRPEVVCTPHTAFNCVEAIERINRVTVENIKAFVAGTPINTLSPGIAPEGADTGGLERLRAFDEEKRLQPGTGFRLCDSGTRRYADHGGSRGADAYNRLRS